MKRGDPSICTYGKATPASSRSEANNNANDSRGKAQERLRQLEQLVMQMVDNTNASTGNPKSSLSDSDPADASIANEGHLQYGSSESRYVGSTHWSAILQNIQELKTALGTQNASTTELDEAEDAESQDAESLFGPVGHLSLAQILAQSLPPRLQVDRRMATYFNSRYMVIPFIHTAQFQRQYEQFWKTPLETPPLWVSILFSICCMAATLSEAVGSEPSTPEDQPSPRISFLNASCQCLRLGGFIRPKRHVVEALALYTQCKYTATLDPAGEVGVIWAILVRHAYRSGYHRDASHFPRFSVFEGEMRRRLWAMLRQFDLMISFQLGLPSQVPPDSWDTVEPRNLLDADFDEHTTVLPPSRPESEPTQILYFIVKSRLMTSFGRVCAQALSFRNSTQKEIMELDAEVRAVHQTVPDTLRIRPMSQSFADPPYLVMVRLNCEFLFQKSICVLHRKYMTQGGYPASTEACTDAAVSITKHMLDLHKEFKPGGQLHADRWMLSSFTMNDFYLASMVLCLGLSMWKKANPGKDMSEDEKIEGQYTLLKDAFGICEELSPSSTEARRIAGVLRVVLGQMGAELPSATTTTATTESMDPRGRPWGGLFGGFPAMSQVSRQNTSSEPLSSHGTSDGFAMPNNFNLAPLSLSDHDAPGFTSSGTQPDAPNLVADFSNFNYGMADTGIAAGTAPNQLQINPFMSFLPFSPSWQQPAQGYPEQTTADGFIPGAIGSDRLPNTLTDTSGSDNTNMAMDVDWTFLDQWMALPDPEQPEPETDILPVPTESNQNNSSSFCVAAVATAEQQDWTSEPYRFLGGELSLNNNAGDEAGKERRLNDDWQAQLQAWINPAQPVGSNNNSSGSGSGSGSAQSNAQNKSNGSSSLAVGFGTGHIPRY